jgi:hypothetical protein
MSFEYCMENKSSSLLFAATTPVEAPAMDPVQSGISIVPSSELYNFTEVCFVFLSEKRNADEAPTEESPSFKFELCCCAGDLPLRVLHLGCDSYLFVSNVHQVLGQFSSHWKIQGAGKDTPSGPALDSLGQQFAVSSSQSSELFAQFNVRKPTL